MQVQSLGRDDPLEKEMASHSSILAWRIPMDRGAWTVHRVTECWTRLKRLGMHSCTVCNSWLIVGIYFKYIRKKQSMILNMELVVSIYLW